MTGTKGALDMSRKAHARLRYRWEGNPMNREMVAKMQYKRIKIRPIARRIEPSGQELPPIDDWWRITEASREKLTVVNPRTSHFVTLGADHIKEFMTDYAGGSDGFLVLNHE